MPLSFPVVRRSYVRPACSTVAIRQRRSARARPWLAALALVVALPAAAFDFEDVARRAGQLAERPYKAPSVALPKTLQNLTYDQYRDIRFKPSMAIWRNAGLPFELQLFHPGLYYDQPVKISEIVRGQPRE